MKVKSSMKVNNIKVSSVLSKRKVVAIASAKIKDIGEQDNSDNELRIQIEENVKVKIELSRIESVYRNLYILFLGLVIWTRVKLFTLACPQN